MFNPKVRNTIIEPKGFFKNLFSIISWPKVIAFALVVIFFVNIGVYIYDKKNPLEVSQLNVSKIDSPFTNTDGDDIVSPNGLFGDVTPLDKGNGVAANPDTQGVFDQKVNENKFKNLSPVARIKVITSSNSQAFRAGDTVFLSALDSYDPDGQISEYRWDFDQNNGLGIDAEGTNTTVKYNNAGIYTITLVVIDNYGAESSSTMTITVEDAPDETPNGIIQGLSTSLIDFNDLNFTSRNQILNAVESSYADFQSTATATLAQAIYNSTQKQLPTLPSLSDIELIVGPEASNMPPTVDTVNPKEGNSVFELRPIISAGFYGNNEIDIHSIELMVDGVSVTPETTKHKFGVQYRPEKELGYGQHNVTLMITDVRGLKTTKSWHFTIVDPKAENSSLIPENIDSNGPEIIMFYPDKNAKNVKPSSDIRISYAEPVDVKTFELAVVDLNTNITKLYTGNQVEWSATNTSVVISGNENIFDYDKSYQIIARQSDELGNSSFYEWFVLGESYNAPEFKVTFPQKDSSHNTPQIKVTGSTDNTNTIIVNGVLAMVEKTGNFSAQINLQLGKNTIEVVAKDLYGKEYTEQFEITYDPESNGADPILVSQNAPIIMDASIRNGEVVTNVRPQISFKFADTDGIDQNSVLLFLDGAEVTTFSMISRDTITYKPLNELTQGEHTVKLVVADKKGNVTNYEMKFTIDAYPDAPNSLTVSLTDNNKAVLLLWDGVTNIENPEYRVYRSSSPNVAVTASTEIARGLKGTTFVDKTVISNATYYYVVVAVSSDEVISNTSNEVVIRVDSTPPPLTIESPKKNEEFAVDVINLVGATEPDAILEVFVNFVPISVPALNTNGTFDIPLTLIPGENIITTIAKDEDGNESVDVRTIIYNVPDTTPPEVVTKTPMGTDVSVSSDIVIEYNEPMDVDRFKLVLKPVNSNNSFRAITITNIELQVSKDKKTFTYNPPKDLEYVTQYSVTVEAYDLAGNESVGDDWDFRTKDKNAPVLEIITPEMNFYTEKDSLTVSGNTEPNINVAISVNGRLQHPSNTSANNGYFAQIIKLEDGNNTISVVATDHLNHSTIAVIEGIYKAPDLEKPPLTVDTPQQNAVVGNSNVFTRGYTENGSSMTISVNGKDQGEIRVENNGSFSHSISLYKGHNLVVYTSTDASGNKTTVGRTVIFDNVGPLLGVTNPIDGYTTNQSTLELRGNTEKVDSSVSVAVRGSLGNPQTKTLQVLADGTFNEFITLSVGNNNIVVTARDSYGNETVIVRTVYYDPVGGQWGTINGNSVNGNSVNGNSVQDTNNPQGNVTSNSINPDPTTSDRGPVNGNSTTDVIDPSTGLPRYTGGDNSAPNISLDTPSGTVTNQNQITFSGKTEQEANVSIYQNGILITNGNADINTGTFSQSVTLNDGKNIFIVDSIDASGNKTSTATVIEKDSKGPNLSILTPKVNETVNTDRVVVYGVTEPNTEVSVTLRNTSYVVSDEFGYFTTEVQTTATGIGVLTVKATDSIGNETVKTVNLNIDKTPPNLNVEYINETAITASPYPTGSAYTLGDGNSTISGTAEMNSRIEVYLDGALFSKTTASRSGRFTVDITSPSGRSVDVEVVCTDNAGNQTSQFFRLKTDSVAPVVQLYSPTPSIDNLTRDTVVVSGMVKDDTPSVRIEVYLNGRNLAGSTTLNSKSSPFSLTVSGVREGSNTLTVEFTDSVGNKTTKTVGYLYSPSSANTPTLTPNTGENDSARLNDLAANLSNMNAYVQSSYVRGQYGAFGDATNPSWDENSRPVPKRSVEELIGLIPYYHNQMVDKNAAYFPMDGYGIFMNGAFKVPNIMLLLAYAGSGGESSNGGDSAQLDATFNISEWNNTGTNPPQITKASHSETRTLSITKSYGTCAVKNGTANGVIVSRLSGNSYQFTVHGATLTKTDTTGSGGTFYTGVVTATCYFYD